jgi:hypothetical protein
MCVRVFVAKKTLTLAKKTHLTNKKCIRRSLKNLFSNVRPWIGKFAIGPKKSQPNYNTPLADVNLSVICMNWLASMHNLKMAGRRSVAARSLLPHYFSSMMEVVSFGPADVCQTAK